MPITILSAGAGSGKTYTLTERMFELIEQGVRPSGIVATTFTQKAAAELYERVRTRLLRSGRKEAAHELGSALIGTVHSIGARLLQRFAFEVGASPRVEIIAEGDHRRLFNESLAQVLDEERIAAMNRLADRLGLTKKALDGTYDWRDDVRRITEAARANMFSAEALEYSKRRSIETFEALLPPVSAQTAEQWHQQLVQWLTQTIEALDGHTADETKTTRQTLEELRDLRTQLHQRGFLYWYEWAKLGKMNAGAKSRHLLEPLKNFAQEHGQHPGFRADVRQYIGLAFDIAADAIAEYQRYKRSRGLIDYADMETQVAQLLRIPAVRAVLSSEIDLLLVDEFQDTSPIQLDLFLQLSQLARQAIWVGDPKQSIYGFRGAEPALMQAVITATGGIHPENILTQSWRSRPALVYLTNAIFTRVFNHLPPEQVALEPALPAERYAHPEAPSAIMHWHFLNQDNHGKVPPKPWLEHLLARQIRALIERRIPVWNKKRTQTRPLRPGDIAVLCRTNRDCEEMAKALHAAGLKAAVFRNGLLSSTEGRLLMACLKYLLNPNDALSAAEILVLSGNHNLDEVIAHRLDYLEQPTFDPWGASDFKLLQHLGQLRLHIADASPAEVLQILTAELQLQHLVVRWGNANQRLDNLDRLRWYAVEYESACQRMQAGASLGGFLLWLNELEKTAADLQGSGEGPETIRVMTYHRSKGLEFPVVVCHQLSASVKDNPWGVAMQSERPLPDLNDILGGRWIRFWVNPYGDQWKKTALDAALKQTDLWQQIRQQLHEEEGRLLYVGLTRARDYLVLPTDARGDTWISRVLFQDAEGTLLNPSSNELPVEWQGRSLSCETAVFYEPGTLPDPIPPAETQVYYFDLPTGKDSEPPPQLWIDPAVEFPPDPFLGWADPEPFASSLTFKGDYSPAWSRAVQAFLTADDPELTSEERYDLAISILQTWGALDSIAPAALLQHADAFSRWLCPGRKYRLAAAFPLEGLVGRRRVRVEVEVFWEEEQQVTALFFADYADEMKKEKERLKLLAPKVAWALHLLKRSQPKPVVCWVVFALEGQAVRAR